MNQIALPLAWPIAEREEDFLLSECNRAAFEHLRRWSTWPVMATVLTGPRKSGRSLLGRIFVRKTDGRLFDDAENHDEEALFHAWNAAQADRKPLLLAADLPPAKWRTRLPDLRSRLLASPTIAIEKPDDILALRLIEKLIQARGLIAKPEVVRYVQLRIERSYIAIGRIVDALDEAALARRRPISLAVAREALATIGVTEDTYRLL